MRCLLHSFQQPLYREGNAVDIYFPGREALLPFEEARVIEIREIKPLSTVVMPKAEITC